jgi:hypothetical protein
VKTQNKVVLYYQQAIIDKMKLSLKNHPEYSYLLKPVHMEKTISLISHLYLKPIIDSRYEDRTDFISLSQDFLIDQYGRDYYKPIIDALQYCKVIEVDHSYKVGEQTKSYRISDDYHFFGFKAYNLRKSSLLYKKQLDHREEQKNQSIYGGNKRTSKNIYVKLERELHNMTIDFAGAEVYLIDRMIKQLSYPSSVVVKPHQYYKKDKFRPLKQLTLEEQDKLFIKLQEQVYSLIRVKVQLDEVMTLERLKKIVTIYHSDLLACTMIRDGQYNFSVDMNGRVHTNLTNLSSELRQFVKLYGAQIIGSDIANSQPLLLALMLIDIYKGATIRPSEVDIFIRLCLAGEFYEYLMEDAGILKTDQQARSNFKTQFFGKVFFNKNPKKRWNKYQKQFQRLFPAVWEIIVEKKKYDYTALANCLQKQEQFIMIVLAGIACLNRKIPILTLHDSLYTTQKYYNEVKDIIIEKFRDIYGIEPTIKN